ncbi:MAG TPA: DUF4149 domain-containing protein [Burkholderiaceae bacterium]
MTLPDRLRRLLPGIWFGLLAAIAFIATPAAFGLPDRAMAGEVVRRIFAWEAPTSLALGGLILLCERAVALRRHEAAGTSQFSAGMMLALGGLLCTVAGYYGLQPAMEAARQGEATALNFGQLHALSTVFFGAKGLLALALAWRALRPADAA